MIRLKLFSSFLYREFATSKQQDLQDLQKIHIQSVDYCYYLNRVGNLF